MDSGWKTVGAVTNNKLLATLLAGLVLGSGGYIWSRLNELTAQATDMAVMKQQLQELKDQARDTNDRVREIERMMRTK